MTSLKRVIAVATVGASLLLMAGPTFAVTAEELLAQIQELQEQLAQLQAQYEELVGEEAAPAIEGCTISSFDRNLKQGMSGDDVKCLQIVLNSDPDTQLAESGVGSPGNETNYFGPLTKAAVIKFQEKYADDVLSPWGLTEGTGFVGSTTRAKLNELLTAAAPAEEEEEAPAEEGEAAVAPGLTVELAEDTPVSGTVVAGSAIAELAKFTFTNGDDTDVKVTQLRLKRTGVSDDTTLPALYLFDGYTRLGDEATLSSGYASFNVASGIFTVPAGGSKTISVRADIKSGVSGQTVGIQLESASDVTTNASSVNGEFPLSGNLMSVATATTPATVTLGTVSPSDDADIDATNNFVIWQNTLTVANQDVELEYLRLTQIGSITADALDNIRLDISGTQVATSELVPSTAGQDLIFDLSASPVSIQKGQVKTVSVYADIVGGASKTIRMSLEKKADIFLKDAAYGCYVSVSGTVPSRTGIQTIKTGTITVTRASDSPTGSVVLNSSSVTLAKFNIKANGEEIKINTLRVRIDVTEASGSDVKYLRNGMLLLDGVQVGGTSAIATDQASTTYTDYSIYQKIAAGTTKVLEVKADIYGCTTTACSSNVLSSGDQIQVEIVGGDLDNAQGMVSLSMIDAPSTTNDDASTLTVGAGTLDVNKNPSYGDQSVAPGSDTKIGSFVLTADQYDTINISRFTVGVSTTTMALTDLSNLYLVYNGTTTTASGSVSSSNAFSVSGVSLAPSTSMTVDIWATISSSVSAGTVSTTLDVTATKATDGSNAYTGGAVDGQTITIATGNLSVNVASDTPISAIVTGQSTEVLMGKFTFSALYESFTVSEVKIKEETSGNYPDYVSVYLKYTDAAGNTVTSGSLPFTDGTAHFTGMTMHVPNGGDADLEVYANLNAVAASGYGVSGSQPKVTLDYYKASSGSQPSVTATNQNKDANPMLLYKTAPTVSIAGATSGTLVNGTNTLYAFTVAADSKGDVGLKKITFNVNGSDGITVPASGLKFYKGSTDYTSYVTVTAQDSDGNAIADLADGNDNTVIVTFDTEEVITADTSQTFYLKVTGVTGVETVGENVQCYIKDDSELPDFNDEGASVAGTLATYSVASAKNFVWSDRHVPVAAGHGESTEDWTDGYLVETLPTDTYTISR